MAIKLRSPQTAHEEFWEHNNCPLVYTYDPTDDGPEVQIGKAIFSTHIPEEVGTERENFQWESDMLDQVVSMIRRETTTEKERAALLLAGRFSDYAERLQLRGLVL